MEDPHQTLENPELEFVTILKQAFKTPFKNARFAGFLLLTSLPLLFFMFLFELLLEKSTKEYLSALLHTPSYLSKRESNWASLLFILEERKMEVMRNSDQQFLLLSVIYLFPLHLLEFFTAFFTIDLASKTQAGDDQNTIFTNTGRRLRGSFLTSIYVSFVLSSCSFGFLALMMNFYGSFFVFELIFLVVFALLLPKYLELTAILNVGLVVSVVDKVQGIGALSYSFYLSKGREKLGRNLMLIFFVLKWGVRIPSMVFKDGEIGVFWRSCLLWVGCLMKWVVCAVYYHHCKTKGFSCSRVDEEVGENLSSSALN